MSKKLPKNWVEVSLKEVTNNRKGKKPNVQSEDEFEGSIPYMDIKALEHNIIRQYADIESSKLFEEDDIAMVWDGARSGWVSKTNMGAIGSTLVAFKPILFNSNYLFYYLLEKYPFINSNARGVGIPHVDPTVLWDLKFPLSPLVEQNRIVEKLNNMFNQLETIKVSMANIPLLLKDFRQQVLSHAVTGKLTEEWRTVKKLESSEKLLQSIIDKRINEFELKCKKAKEKGERKPNTPEYFNYSKKDIHFNYIENWFISPVGFLCDCIVPGRDKPKDFTGAIPWITTPDITTDYITNENAKLFLSDYEIEEVRAKKIPVNSVVISIVGRFGIACVIKSECVINQQLHAFLPSELVLPEYLMYYFKTQESLMNKLSSSTTIAYINKTKANSILVNVPPLKEQEEIISRVESLFAKADAIEQQYKSIKEKIDNLPQALLHKAFKGELTEQLDTDGDAKDLLKEIQNLKTTSKKIVNSKLIPKKTKVYSENKEVFAMVAEPK